MSLDKLKVHKHDLFDFYGLLQVETLRIIYILEIFQGDVSFELALETSNWSSEFQLT